MKPTRESVLAYFLEVLQTMGEEWEDSTAATEDTLIMGNLNWRSIEIVYLANALQQHYGQVFPFEEFLKTVGERESKDATVGEWVSFVHEHLADTPPGGR
jgi:acyl carrier protein